MSHTWGRCVNEHCPQEGECVVFLPEGIPDYIPKLNTPVAIELLNIRCRGCGCLGAFHIHSQSSSYTPSINHNTAPPLHPAASSFSSTAPSVAFSAASASLAGSRASSTMASQATQAETPSDPGSSSTPSLRPFGGGDPSSFGGFKAQAELRQRRSMEVGTGAFNPAEKASLQLRMSGFYTDSSFFSPIRLLHNWAQHPLVESENMFRRTYPVPLQKKRSRWGSRSRIM